ncbi:copper amine oxidase N-terminal domain-containing protein [Paenibacillus whitsoniae]|uniref:Copper amine oxidase N-terminal domain-containing protein n=1 Tax=Paenibacillus whitsoniae TaxID=2496558 RepID=A0A3S0A5V9_9BACL|nr:copper amine oxidase N-terminal domain-containing protein [Paenibacillus whitsoniae]RTE10329.1 copper amine oxidase N-terminal domain-containing protein [Paenibacillus whitsoniae]
MKKVIIFLALFALIQAPTQLFAKGTSMIAVSLDGEPLSFSTPPFIQEGVTLVQFRPLFEKLGLHIVWDAETRTITGSKGDLSIVLQINNKTATINGVQFELEVAPQIVNDDTVVPIRFVAETAHRKVTWNSETEHIQIEGITHPTETAYDFRHVNWGMSKSEVLDAETSELFKKQAKNTLTYQNVDFMGYTTYLTYQFIEDNLVFATYAIPESVTFDIFYELKNKFIQQYGKPSSDYEEDFIKKYQKETYSSLFNKHGVINASVSWNNSKTTNKPIVLAISGENNKLQGISIGFFDR